MLVEKNELKNAGVATARLFIPRSSKCRIQFNMRKFTCVIYANHTGLSGCTARNGLLGFHINHKITIAIYLPQDPRTSTNIEHCWNNCDDDVGDEKVNQSTRRKSYPTAVLTTRYVIGPASNPRVPIIY
jgi:hypothetical protein